MYLLVDEITTHTRIGVTAYKKDKRMDPRRKRI